MEAMIMIRMQMSTVIAVRLELNWGFVSDDLGRLLLVQGWTLPQFSPV